MNDQELIKKIKKLKQIKPSGEWLNSTRHNLTAQISFEEEKKTGFFNWLYQPHNFALAVCLIAIFAGGPWLMIKASQASLPGEALYSVKKITENVQATVASESSKTKLQFEFAQRRLEELNKITEDSVSSEKKEEKAEQTKKVISDFKDKLAGASLHVSKISKEEAVEVAKKAKKIKEELDRTKEEISLEIQEIQNELAEAEKQIEEINYQILTVLTKEIEEITEKGATTTDKEIIIFLEETETGTMTTTQEIINEPDEIKE